MKNVLIFGDSYSTFKGYIPEGYDIYYSEEGHEGTDVRKVEETWWHQVISETNMNMVLNDSWSGSTIGYTGYDNADNSDTKSFICRLNKMEQRGFFKENKIDTVFVFGGTNDSWSNAPIGEMKYSDWSEKDLYFVLPAISFFLKRVKEVLPDSDIVCIINSELKEEITEGLKAASKYYGISTVELENIDKNCGHPTIKGMKGIAKQVIGHLV